MKQSQSRCITRLLAALVIVVTICLLLISMAPAAPADEPTQAQSARGDLTELSLEDLMNIEVISASKKAERLSDTSAAVYVITQEDIRRSGVTSIAEALRMATGLDVGHIDGNKWAISSRGLQSQYANEMLVLMDGRSVYDPLFSGVYWDVQDTMLEDIERIEVIRGPGATMWGANAVNGIINIITKSAGDTQGGLVTGVTGSEDKALAAVRYGGTLGRSGFYRVYMKGFDRGDSAAYLGNAANDSWNQSRGGFRIDMDMSEKDALKLQGDIYRGRANQTLQIATLTPPFSETITDTVIVSGGNLMARWNRITSDTSNMALQLYYDRTERRLALAGVTRDTFDLDFQNLLNSGGRHEIIWGLGYRVTSDDTQPTWNVSFDPLSRTDHILSAFVQDEITLTKDRLRLTLGSKFEHNDYTGLEIQPNARLLYTPDPRHTVWAAVSRAVRTPSRGERSVRANLIGFPDENGTPIIVALMGNEDFRSEELLAHEVGYRARPTDWLSFDVAAFYNQYDDLYTAEPMEPFLELSPPPPHIVVPQVFTNTRSGKTYGIEVAANLDVTDRWRLAAGYTWLHLHLHNDPLSTANDPEVVEDASPHKQFQLRSYLDLSNGFELDAAMYYVGNLPTMNIPSYTRFDLRLGWRPTSDLDVSVGVRNLFNDRHPEYWSSEGTQMTKVERNVYGKVTWKF